MFLTDRDIHIIEFILDMKFASVQDVFEKFFKITLSGEQSRSSWWAVRRLQQLEKAGYIKGVFSFSERTKFYLGTWKGYYACLNRMPESEVSKPAKAIDHHTFNHDRKVLESRLILENQRAASFWISDKRLRSNSELAGGLTLTNVPDGIFGNSEGKRVAIEVELTTKTKSVYAAKVRKYVAMIRSKDSKVKVFDKVLYVIAREGALNFLKNETKIYGDLFEIKSFQEFFGHTSNDILLSEKVLGDQSSVGRASK